MEANQNKGINIMEKNLKDLVFTDLEEILQEVHKCGYFGESWQKNEKVTNLIKNFEKRFLEVSK